MPITIKQIEEAGARLKNVVANTPLQLCKRLSEEYGARIYLKREDLQEVRSFKIRGAYNKISTLTPQEKERGVVCASAGNHAQGVAYSCAALKIKGTIFMPVITPNQKIERVKHFGGEYINVQLSGNTYDDASSASHQYCEEHGAIYVHAFNDPLTIAGQGTIAAEIYEELAGQLDVLLSPIGGGGLISGVASYLKQKKPGIAVIGAEPEGSPSMYEALKQNRVVTLDTIDSFVDGAAVKTSGELSFELCKKYTDRVILVPEGLICTTMIELYQNEGIIAEPAGALGVAPLSELKGYIEGKTVVCILSGGNNDILRYPEIMERSLVYQGRKHYFIVEFAQKPGQLKLLVDKALGPTDDIARFEYIKKTNKEKGAALVGIELRDKKDLEPLIRRMREIELNFRILSDKEMLYDYLI
jgi:threonine dehydratase